MNRDLWTQQISANWCPPWPCPFCGKGTLALSKDSFQFKEGARSARARKSEDWDPDWIEYSFTAWAHCNHLSCKENFAISGKGGVTQMYVDDSDWDWTDIFQPLHCYPMPNIFTIPRKCPPDVEKELRVSFSVFWNNPAASASRLRVALESLLNHVGIKKKMKSAGGKIQDLTLHARIELFAKKNPVVGPQLMALKWLGNSGSHNGDVSRAELLDAYEIMEHALGEIIEQRSKHVAKLAKKLTKKHGP